MKDKPPADLQPIELLKPIFDQATTVFEALKMRKTIRSFSQREIPLQLLSDILWAAQGVNRGKGPFDGPGRTAGSASNSQEILIYVTREEGTYLYEPDSYKLTPVADGDYRPLAIGPRQRKSGSVAAIRLIYVVDLDKFKTAGFPEPGLYDPEIQKSYYFVDTGLIAQNVYLAASALGLVSWFHNCNKSELVKVLKLTSQQRPLFGHTVGYSED
ncbi:MAG: nitroreductase family protein [Candidatus Bathyarchaeia archaeon]